MKIEQVAINAVSTTHADLIECLDAYAGAGFKHIEFPIPLIKQFLDAGNTLADAKRELDSRGLACVGGFEAAVLCFAAGDELKAGQDYVLNNARILGELGAKTMVVGTDGPPEGEWCENPTPIYAEAFAAMGEIIAPTGVSLCIEFNWSPLIKSFSNAAEVARQSLRDNVGVLFDPCHFHCTPSKLHMLTPENIATIKHVHVDNMPDKPGELCCDGDRVLPGDPAGCMDLAAMFARFDECGYAGYYSIEMFHEGLWAMPAADAAKKMYDAMLTLV